jgi:Na+/H+ antiporter NhaD/arsenite permease-like protein
MEISLISQIVAGTIFIITFVAILADRIDRTIVALVGASAMIISGLLLGFYSQAEAFETIDLDTLGLLLGMMILVALLADTGFFQYLATFTAKRSGGNPWRLLVILGTITTLLSMLLDNVTTIVLIAPVTILIAEILGISPIPYLMAEALLSNTGGVATLVGDPPNILIGSAANLSFTDFLVNLAPIVLVAWIAVLFMLKFLFRKELAKRAEDPEAIQKLDENSLLKDRESLRKILMVLAVVILLFFSHSVLHLSPSFIAIAGAATALLLIKPDMEEMLKEIEWSILLFFSAVFIVVGGLEASGILGILAEQLTSLAFSDVLLTGVILIWAGAGLSAIVDNIPYTIIMIPIIQDLGTLGVEIGPLWWALALGAGFGGNGTPIGSTANIITIRLSERTRTPITTALWLKTGLPVMIVTSLIGSLLYALTFSRM